MAARQRSTMARDSIAAEAARPYTSLVGGPPSSRAAISVADSAKTLSLTVTACRMPLTEDWMLRPWARPVNAKEQQEALQWLARAFTAIGGDYCWGIVSGSDRCPRDRAAELAVRLRAVGRPGSAHGRAINASSTGGSRCRWRPDR
jgi:hypothetical protein